MADDMTHNEFLVILEQKSDADVRTAYEDFRQRLESKHGLRVKFVPQTSQLSLYVKPLRAKPKGARKYIPTIAFAVSDTRLPNRKGVCFTMKSTEIHLDKYGYSSEIADRFYDGLATVDSRLTPQNNLVEQLPLNELNTNKFRTLEGVIDELTAAIGV